MSKDQRNTAKAFTKIWSYSSPYYYFSKSQQSRDRQNYENKSNKFFYKFIFNFFKKNKSREIKFLDVGCGGGYTFSLLFSKFIPKINYIGIDIHNELNITYNYLYKFFKKYNKKPTLIKTSMNAIPKKKIFKNIDFAWAEGSLHHSESVDSSIKQIAKILKKRGIFIFWIINENKPLRKITDQFFRNYALKTNNEKKILNEFKNISSLSIAFGKALKNKKIYLNSDIKSLGIKAGTHKLQQILYNYIIKFYFSKVSSLKYHSYILYDWFRPKFYHQTNSKKLKKILKKNKLRIIKMVSKTNGHFVVCEKR